jgi:peptide/nickel transport system permease protein
VTPTFVRLQRASSLSWAERPFITAARSYGAGHARIAFKEILPNSILSVITFVPTIVAVLIVAEGSLSFLGLGVPPPQASWGGMIADGKSQLNLAPQLVFVPAVVVFVTVFSLNIIGERVRARFEGVTRVT